MFNRDNNPIAGNQLPLNNTQVRSTGQLPVNKEDSFNQESHKCPFKQTQHFHNGMFTPDNTSIAEEQLPPKTVSLGPNGNEHKRSVQFRNPENGQGQNNPPNHKTGIYDPILITPRHLHTNSPLVEPREPERNILLPPPSDPRGKYFSGTVEDGKGGDFFGYYFTANHGSGIATKRKMHVTSTPRFDNYPNTPETSKQIGDMEPRTLFASLKSRNLGPSYASREREIEEMIPKNGHSDHEQIGNHSDYGEIGPCLNCKDYGHFSRHYNENLGNPKVSRYHLMEVITPKVCRHSK